MSVRNKADKGPAERDQTLRQALLVHLRQGACTARDLSQLVGIREKDVPEHLEHLRNSARNTGEVLQVTPAECAACGFLFEDRRRLTKPSGCPRCRSQRIEPPVFQVALRNPVKGDST